MKPMASLEPDLDPGLQARFAADGFINYGRILDDAEIRALSSVVADMCAGASAVPPDHVRYYTAPEQGAQRPRRAQAEMVWQILNAHLFDPVVAKVSVHPRITRIVACLLGAPGEVITSQIITKPAGHGDRIPWHQDSSYWGDRQVVTCWLAIDDATPFNGCMRMIPGSHLGGQRAFTARMFPAIGIELRETDGVDESLQVYVPVPAGCASFHAQGTLHASAGNATDKPRRAIAITYAASAPTP